MGLIAKWLSKTWEVSPQKIYNITELSTGYKMKEGSTANKVELETQSLTVGTYLNNAVGLDTEKEIESWRGLIGQIAPFYFGGKQFGTGKFQLIGVNPSDFEISELGQIYGAKLSLEFTEYRVETKAKKAIKSKTSTNKTTTPAIAKTADLSATKTALGIGPSNDDKARLKPS